MRLIDAEMLAEKKFIAVELIGYGENVAYRIGWNDAIDAIIENEPTIDAVSVVRSEWIMDMGEVWICRNCGNGYKDQPTCMGKPMFEYCPFCGAKMDGEREGE